MRLNIAMMIAVLLISRMVPADSPILLYDFTEGMHGWTGNPRVTNMKVTDEGLYFESIGHDPWIESPPVENMPLGDRVRITLRMRSDGDSSGELYYGPGFVAERQSRFFVKPDGAWHEYSLLLPAQESGTRLRVDPAGGTGAFTLAWIKAEAVRPLITPAFTAPVPIHFDEVFEVRSGPMTLSHNGREWDGYALGVFDEALAMGHSDAALGFLVDGQPVMFSLSEAHLNVSLEHSGSMVIEARFTDAGGANWTLVRTVEARRPPGTLWMRTTIRVDAEREIFHLPWLTLFPGLGSFGEHKTQAILPGVEYLEDEPSSSEADFNATQADRRIVEDHKLTLPMMALQHEGRYLGIVWNRADKPAAVFDSPDRVFNSGAHLMGLWHPGVGDLRLENEFSVFGAFTLKPNAPIEMELMFLGGEGHSIVPAVQHYVALRGLPALPQFEGGLDHAVRLLSAGWIDSEGHHDGLWRHAVWGDAFPPHPVADAPAFMLWLSQHTDDNALATRLREAARRGLERLTPPDNYLAGVGHVQRPTPTLLFGELERNIERMVEQAKAALGQFDREGLRRYHQPDPKRPDYGRTHFADHANGYGAQLLETILEAAVFSGDKDLAESGLALLDKQTGHYADTVPRGAQTWEMPLHTPDILGSARLVRTYILGYLLSGREEHLEEARYWAWTGVPFLYLDHPVEGPVGTYATIAVLGATNWVAPNWIGLPVQWCGLVYRSALHDLARLDAHEGDFWDKIAQGVTLSGLQQTFPVKDERRQGLLPDFFHLREQISDGPAISPGTVQAHVHEVFDKTAYYSVERIGVSRTLIHAPGAIQNIDGSEGNIAMDIDVWTDAPYWVRITHVPEKVKATWNDGTPLDTMYDVRYGALNIQLMGNGRLHLSDVI